MCLINLGPIDMTVCCEGYGINHSYLKQIKQGKNPPKPLNVKGVNNWLWRLACAYYAPMI